jgi:disulfide oxidoreductase YuzD
VISYHDASRPEVVAEHGGAVERIKEQGLIYPVTFVDGEPMYDGAVSYPAILRAVQTRLSPQ